MNLENFKKLATASAIALSFAYIGNAIAAPIQIGTAVPIAVTATVENTIDVTVTRALGFGEIGAIKDAASTATMTVAADGTITDDPGGGWLSASPASIVSGDAATALPAIITVTAAFPSVDLYVDYNNRTNPVEAGGEEFTLTEVHDNLSAPVVGTPGGTDGSTDFGATPVTGIGGTDGTGNLTFNIGGTLTTQSAPKAAYTDGVYTGSFDAIFAY